MEMRNLGRSGLTVSVIGLGCNNFGMKLDLEGTRAVLDRAIGAGITLLDTADGYGDGKSEEFMGEILGARRKDIVLATKFGSTGMGSPRRADRRYVIQACEASLKRLKTDWIDLYQLHWPDPNTPIDETLRALDDLITAGKVRYIGSSNFAGWQVVDADWTAKTEHLHRFISCQNEYSLIERGVEKELLPAVAATGQGFLPYFPLASGMLTGKYRRGEEMPEGSRLSGARWAARLGRYLNYDLVEKLEAFASARGHTVLELAFSWLLAQPNLTSVIAGATTPAQVDANAAAGAWTLTADDLAGVRAILDGNGG